MAHEKSYNRGMAHRPLLSHQLFSLLYYMGTEAHCTADLVKLWSDVLPELSTPESLYLRLARMRKFGFVVADVREAIVVDRNGNKRRTRIAYWQTTPDARERCNQQIAFYTLPELAASRPRPVSKIGKKSAPKVDRKPSAKRTKRSA